MKTIQILDEARSPRRVVTLERTVSSAQDIPVYRIKTIVWRDYRTEQAAREGFTAETSPENKPARKSTRRKK